MLILMDNHFDKAIIFLIRSITKNFLEAYKDRSINGLPIELAPIVQEEADA